MSELERALPNPFASLLLTGCRALGATGGISVGKVMKSVLSCTARRSLR